MANVRMVRERASALPWLRGAVFLAATWLALAALPFYPSTMRPIAAIVCGALGVFAPAVGVMAIVLVLAVPLAAGDFVAGVLFLVIGLASVGYLGQRGARAFVIVALAFLATLVHAEWALAPLAGYLIGASEGAAAACVAVVVLEVAGIAFGRTLTGVVVGGGTKAVVDAARIAAVRDPLTFGWLAPAVAKMNVAALIATVSHVRYAAVLVLQPVLWGVSAALAGSIAKPAARVRSIGGVASATVALGIASAALVRLAGGTAVDTPAAVGTALVVSLVVCIVAAATAEYVFPLVPVADEAAPRSLKAEDADVDELLRTIANAEEALEDRHSTDATVLITDMKAFSRMTQEQGTLATAKAIQKHRDLLLPIVTKAGGHGKSTGGDGLLAAFHSADDALAAAVEMQRALKKYNEKKTADKQISVRIGLASGDVIIDRGGCPFIGDGLNLAARVMSLADGGQVFAAADVVDAAADLPTPVMSHGEFSLKNISLPVNVYEVLWDEGQQPRRPEFETTAA